MTAHEKFDEDDLAIADSWGRSVTDDLERSRRVAWMVAAGAGALALLLAVALVILLPLRQEVPVTILVDRQTGNVETLTPGDPQLVTPDAALTRSFLVQYVVARESFDMADLQSDYRKVALWSGGDERRRYVDMMRPGSPGNPVAIYPASTRISVDVRSVSSLAAGRALVRFSTTQTDLGSQPQATQHWAAVIDYTFSAAEMTEDDRFVNPLGFQVTRYRRDPETLPEVAEPGAADAVQLQAEAAE
ncbi:MAG: hypothetical protein KDE15_11030 [Erythrobacter sp.]|nr:hypothetical protein [Erythrobacter sp.]